MYLSYFPILRTNHSIPWLEIANWHIQPCDLLFVNLWKYLRVEISYNILP